MDLSSTCIFLFTGSYIAGPEPPTLIHEAILELTAEVKDDAVALADAIAPPDFILNSPIGKSDGEVRFGLDIEFSIL